jgi:hypothetical protein
MIIAFSCEKCNLQLSCELQQCGKGLSLSTKKYSADKQKKRGKKEAKERKSTRERKKNALAASL